MSPLTHKDFSTLMDGLGLAPSDGPFAVAVSGGPDSMALTLLMKAWGETTTLTFDHGLRKESAKEAQQVGMWVKDLGLKHEILTWAGEKPATGIQAAARQARYQALEGWCRDHGINYLLLAHTLNDQAETFLMRLMRGSGVDGLSAMAPLSPPVKHPDGPQLARPLLSTPKTVLIETLDAAGQDYIRDPSNENPDFLRVQVRQLLAETDIEGFNAETLTKTAARMARVRNLLEGLTNDLLKTCLSVSFYGFGELDLRKWRGAHEEVELRALSRMLVYFGGGNYPPRLEQVERLSNSLGDKTFSGATLAGCRLDPKPKHPGMIILSREVAAIRHVFHLKPGEQGIWDGRFEVQLDKKGSSGEVHALGKDGWTAVKKQKPELKDLSIPHNVILGLPALFREGRLKEVPHLKFPETGGHLSVLTDPGRKVF